MLKLLLNLIKRIFKKQRTIFIGNDHTFKVPASGVYKIEISCIGGGGGGGGGGGSGYLRMLPERTEGPYCTTTKIADGPYFTTAKIADNSITRLIPNEKKKKRRTKYVNKKAKSKRKARN